jgi:hypothetical protein
MSVAHTEVPRPLEEDYNVQMVQHKRKPITSLGYK